MNVGSVGANAPPSSPSAVASMPAATMSRGSRRSTSVPATGPTMAPPTQMRLTVSAVAAREPPNSWSNGGKNTGNVLAMPETSIIVVNASHSRALTRLSRSGIPEDCATRAYNATVLETIELETGPAPTAAVIWLHGLGADGHDFEPIVPELDLPDAPAVRFVFPHAPRQ